MIRLLRVAIAAGTVVSFAACTDAGPTDPKAAPAATVAGDLVVQSAPTPSASCTVTPNGTYDVTVSWSAISVTNIELWQSGGIQPLAQRILGHPTRKGSEMFTLNASPDFAQISGRQGGARVNCV
jgi:hypothetical protein